jgi:hypothetical protein
MEEILSDIKSGRWWFSTVFIAIIVGIITNIVFEFVIKKTIENRNGKIILYKNIYYYITIIFGCFSGFILSKTKLSSIITTDDFLYLIINQIYLLYIFLSVYVTKKILLKTEKQAVVNIIIVVILYAIIELLLLFCINITIDFFVYYRLILFKIFIILYMTCVFFCFLPITAKLPENIFTLYILPFVAFFITNIIYIITYEFNSFDFFIVQGGMFAFLSLIFTHVMGD